VKGVKRALAIAAVFLVAARVDCGKGPQATAAAEQPKPGGLLSKIENAAAD